MLNNMETIYAPDKQQRNAAFADLRQNGTALERQCVKVSTQRQVKGEDGKIYWVSVYGIAYPRN